MAIDLDKYQKLKTRSEKAKSEADKAEGVLQEQMKKLKEEFDVDSLEEAETKLVQLDTELADVEIRYNTELQAFESKWGDKF